MKVELSYSAQRDLDDYLKYTSRMPKNAENYVSKLVTYSDMLSSLGVFVLQKRNYQIRQLIFRQHRIFYSVYSNIVFIISIVHMHKDINSYLNYFKEILV